MTLIDLPEDVLFHIISFLLPPHILLLRLVSKQFATLTRQPSVWLNAYRISPYFLPEDPPLYPPKNDGRTLEEIILRSMHLDSHWHSLTPTIAKQRILLSSPNKTPTDTIKLYHGRYLMVGARSSFVFYDLDAPDWETPSFGSGATDATFTFYRGDTNQNAAVSYISAVAATRWPVYTIRIWRIDFEKKMLHREADVPIGRQMSGFAKITNGWLVHGCNRDPASNAFRAVLFHIPTSRTYEVPVYVPARQGGERIFQIDYIISHTHIFILYISREYTLFEAFPLPDPSEPQTASNTVLASSHTSRCHGGFTETTLVFSKGATTRLLGHSVTTPMQGMRMFDATLQPDGSILFSAGLHAQFSPGYNIHVSHAKGHRIRGLCMAPTTFGLLRIDGDRDGLVVSDMSVDTMEGPTVYDVEFDGFRGRMCLVKERGIVIVDFV